MAADTEFELLRWSVSETLPFPESAGAIEEEKLFLLAGKHRVIPRLLDRIEREAPYAVSASLKARLRFAQMRIERHMNHQAEQTRAIARLTDSPFVYIKGATLYALTGERRVIRQSGDIDLLASDPEALFEVMCRAGFTGERKSDDYRGPTHEHSILLGSGVGVEIHRCHFIHYGQLVGKRKDFPLAWSNFCGVNPIFYSDLSSFIVHSPVNKIRGLPVLAPAAAAIMLCCHIGTALVRVHTQHLKSTLGELSDLVGLVNHPDFVLSDFMALVQKYKAEQIACLAISMVRHFLNTSLFEIENKLMELSNDIDCCAPSDSHVCFGVELQEMLQPKTLQARVNTLNKFTIEADGAWRVVPEENCIYRGAYDSNTEITATYSENQVQIQCLWRVIPDERSEVHFWCSTWVDEDRSSIVYRDKAFFYTEGTASITASETEDGILFTVSLDEVSLPDRAPVLLVLQYWRYGQEHYEDKKEKRSEPVLILPLEIVPPMFLLRKATMADLNFLIHADLDSDGDLDAYSTWSSEAQQEHRQKIAGFVQEEESKSAWVYVDTERNLPIGTISCCWRNRSEQYGIFGELPELLFPADGRFCEIFQLWVDPAFRRRGLGTRLKEQVEVECKQRGVGMIYTHTEEHNLHVIELNQRLGYREVRRGPIWDEAIRVSLVKRLE